MHTWGADLVPQSGADDRAVVVTGLLSKQHATSDAHYVKRLVLHYEPWSHELDAQMLVQFNSTEGKCLSLGENDVCEERIILGLFGIDTNRLRRSVRPRAFRPN